MGGGASKSKKPRQDEGEVEQAQPPEPAERGGADQDGSVNAAGLPPKKGIKVKKPKYIPPAVDADVLQHASQLGLNISNPADEEFLWIAERAARDIVRPPWVRLLDERDGKIYYFNGSTQVSSWTTPYLEQYKKLLRQRRQMKKQADAIAAATAAAEADGDAEAVARAKVQGPEKELYWVDMPDKVGCVVPAPTRAVFCGRMCIFSRHLCDAATSRAPLEYINYVTCSLAS